MWAGHERLSANLPRLIVESIELLVRAYRYSRDVACDPWQFSANLAQLESSSLDRSDLRWLVLGGWLLNRLEVTGPGAIVREFGRCLGSHIDTHSAFILTAEGYVGFQERLAECDSQSRSDSEVSLAVPRLPEHSQSFDAFESAESIAGELGARLRPRWQATHRELWYCDILVKRFRVPAPNQELILTAFQEEDWPICIDDPLPQTSNLDPRCRLQGTIKCLNRNQQHPVIGFFGTGRGCEVGWKLLRSSGRAYEPPVLPD